MSRIINLHIKLKPHPTLSQPPPQKKLGNFPTIQLPNEKSQIKTVKTIDVLFISASKSPGKNFSSLFHKPLICPLEQKMIY
jgi:hypothetical protein